MYIHTYLEVYATQSSGTQITHTHTHNHIHASRVGCCQALDVRNGYCNCVHVHWGWQAEANQGEEMVGGGWVRGSVGKASRREAAPVLVCACVAGYSCSGDTQNQQGRVLK